MKERTVHGEVVQVLEARERSDYCTTAELDRLAGNDCVVVLHDDPPSRLDRWLPWRSSRPMHEWAPTVLVSPERAPQEGETVTWGLRPSSLEKVYVRDYRTEG